MKTTTLAVVLSVFSLGAVAALYVKVDDLSEQLRMARASRGDSSRARAESMDPEYVIRKQDPRVRAESNSRGDGLGADSEHDLASAPKSIEHRLAQLEKREQARKSSSNMWGNTQPFRMPQFARTVDDLGKQLKLTASQKDRITVATDRGKARIDEILSIPGADGKTMKEVRAERRRKIQEAMADPEKNAGNFVALAMSGHRRMNEKIPGRNETYRQEVDRIKKETREEIDGTLNSEQQEQFKDTRIDSMLGDTGSHVAFTTSIARVGPDDGEPAGGIMIAEGVDIEIDSSEKKEE